MYHLLQDLWAPLTDTLKVFDPHGSANATSTCVSRRYGKPFLLLSPLRFKYKRMQTVLIAREIVRMMLWDGDSKSDINKHFASITELHSTTGRATSVTSPSKTF